MAVDVENPFAFSVDNAEKFPMVLPGYRLQIQSVTEKTIVVGSKDQRSGAMKFCNCL